MKHAKKAPVGEENSAIAAKPRRVSKSALFVAVAISFAGMTVHSLAQQPQGGRTPDVKVTTLRQVPVTIVSELPGRTVAFENAEVRPQISGLILRRLFVEGEEVSAGDQLYQIDPAPYEVALSSSEAALARARAAASLAQGEAVRQRSLIRTRVASQRDVDTAEATLQQAQADVTSAEAAVRAARINLDYTRVLSPIGGRTSRSAVTTGALVTANQSESLLSITRLDPIYVDLTQPNARLLQQQRAVSTGTLKRENADQAVARLTLEDGSVYPHEGRLQFSEIIVDRGTGSITLRALFPNPEGKLMPGMFVRAHVEEGVTDRGLLVPQQAVQRTPKGEPFTFVVTAEGKAEQRMLKTERAIGANWLVTDGVAAGDRVIVEGVQRVRPGSQVNAAELAAEPAAETGASARLPDARTNG